MIYLKESLNIDPASPATRDRVVDIMNKYVLPANERLGARLVGGFFAHEDWFTQIIHVTEFDSLSALDAYRQAASTDGDANEGAAQLANLAPERRSELLEPLGPVAVDALHAAIAASADEPVGTYTFAILDVTEGRMDEFKSLLAGAAARLPIVAALNDVVGNPNRVIDLWKGDTGRPGYKPNDPGQEAFFGPLRQIAPREKMMRLHPLPYSPLQ